MKKEESEVAVFLGIHVCFTFSRRIFWVVQIWKWLIRLVLDWTVPVQGYNCTIRMRSAIANNGWGRRSRVASPQGRHVHVRAFRQADTARQVDTISMRKGV